MNKIEVKVLEARTLIESLIENTENTRQLALISGVDQSVVYKLVKGQKSFDNLSLKTVEKLYKIALEYKVRDEVIAYSYKENELIEVEEIEEGVERFTSVEYGQYGWNFNVINKGTVYFKDGTEKIALITYTVEEVKAPQNTDAEALWHAYCESTTGAEQERAIALVDDETADMYMELVNAEHFSDIFEENKLSYVVDISKSDKEISVFVKEGDLIYDYTIKPEYFKDIDYIVELIKDENLNSVFDGEDITDDDPLEYEYSIKEVRNELERLA